MSDLPYEFPLRCIPGNVWPPLPARMATLWNAYLELCRTERYTPEQIEALQLTQLGALWRHARLHVPYYRAKLQRLPERIGSLQEWREVPLLARSTYQQAHSEFLAEQLPAGTKRTTTAYTAGSSGIPVTIHQTNIVQLWWQAMNLRDLRWSDVDVRSSLVAIRYYGGTEKQKELLKRGITLPNWNDHLKELMVTGPSHAFDIHQDPEKQLEFLRSKKPDYLISYPSNLAALSRLALDTQTEFPTVRAVLCVSEALTAEVQALIESAFGAPTKNTYSCMEAGYLASPCPHNKGLHVHSENVLFEILDEDGQPTLPGQVGRVVITTLRNFLTPLLRYEIMDQAAWASEPCGCGINLPLIEPPWGKRHPPFVLSNGQRKNSMGLAVGMRKIGGMMQFRIRQERRDKVTVRVCPGKDWSRQHEASILDLMSDFFEGPVSCEISLMQGLEVSPSGKAGHLECQVEDDLS